MRIYLQGLKTLSTLKRRHLSNEDTFHGHSGVCFKDILHKNSYKKLSIFWMLHNPKIVHIHTCCTNLVSTVCTLQSMPTVLLKASCGTLNSRTEELASMGLHSTTKPRTSGLGIPPVSIPGSFFLAGTRDPSESVDWTGDSGRWTVTFKCPLTWSN